MSSKKGLLAILSQHALENEPRVDEQGSKRREKPNFGGENLSTDQWRLFAASGEGELAALAHIKGRIQPNDAWASRSDLTPKFPAK